LRIHPQNKYITIAQKAPHEMPMNAKVLRGDHFSEERWTVVPRLRLTLLRLISRSMKISGMVPRLTLQTLRAFCFTVAPTRGQ